MARITDFQSVDAGSIPVGTTKKVKKDLVDLKSLLIFVKQKKQI
jgi:hypothetical protein